ncbi:hypothetical protein GCM10022383_03330 [Microbacterium soli]|uniref:Uncharacterized protein n=1 Tax=Microbacterium soli TaxID=446075 RepID=A0ABP7MPP0_9MICO
MIELESPVVYLKFSHYFGRRVLQAYAHRPIEDVQSVRSGESNEEKAAHRGRRENFLYALAKSASQLSWDGNRRGKNAEPGELIRGERPGDFEDFVIIQQFKTG